MFIKWIIISHLKISNLFFQIIKYFMTYLQNYITQNTQMIKYMWQIQTHRKRRMENNIEETTKDHPNIILYVNCN